MSLINDALKKAQKLQMQGQAPPPPIPSDPSGVPSQPASPGRDRPLPGQMFMLLAFGAGVLMALSVLATVYLLRHPSTPVVAQAPAAPILPEQPSVASVIKITPPALSQSVPPFTPAQNPSPIPPPALEKSPPPVPSATAPAVAATPAAPVSMQSPAIILPLPSAPSSSSGLDSSKPDPKILAYIDALQVAGVRVSDTGSKVLMNDRVYRQNEIVDHLLGLRLEKIESDTLTFIDERGVIYTKNL
jgi:hypothetical protein